MAKKNKNDDKFLALIKDFIVSMVISLVLVIFITRLIARPVRVEGKSMLPTLHDQEVGFSNIFGLKIGNPDRFDVVVAYLEEEHKYIVKRVIGLPGDTVEIRKEQLYINEKPVDQPFLDPTFIAENSKGDGFTYDFGPVKVPDNEYFLLGDNRPNSSDSRMRGTFKRDDIKSKDVFIIYPLNMIRLEGK